MENKFPKLTELFPRVAYKSACLRSSRGRGAKIKLKVVENENQIKYGFVY